MLLFSVNKKTVKS